MRLPRILGVLGLPIVLAHEFVHLLAVLPWVRDWSIHISPDGGEIQIWWKGEKPPRPLRVWFHIAPTVLGTALGALVAFDVLRGGSFPLEPSVAYSAEWVVFALAWALFTWPSRLDRAGALGVVRGE